MKVGIYETDHFEGAYPVIRLFDNGKNQITIFTNENTFRQFQYLFENDIKNYHWVIKRSAESKYRFISGIFKTARKKQFDILYLNTIADNHAFYAALIASLRNTRVIVTLHDINGYFKFRPAASVRRWIRYVGKRWLIKEVKEFNVVSTTMVDYLKKKLPFNKQVHCVPGCVFEETKHHDTGIITSIEIVVPGTIDSRRRNYEFVFDLLEKINEKNLPIRITLLGGVHNVFGKAIIDQCKQYILRRNNLRFFQDKVVDQPIFDKHMDDAHFIFIPSVVNTVLSDGIPETYGISISSGNIFDVIKHAKPFITPTLLKIPDDLKSSCFTYQNAEEIISFLVKMLTDQPQYGEWKQNAFLNSQHYTIEKLRINNPSLFM